MTTAKQPRKPAAKAGQQMCIVNIGYQQFALPLNKGLALVDLMQSAEKVRHDIDGPGVSAFRIEAEQWELGLEVVRPGQVLPASAPTLH